MRYRVFTRGLSTAFATALVMTFGGAALALEPVEGAVMLTVSGAIAQRNEGDVAQFDFAMLESLGGLEVETSTIWTEGVQTFEGVELIDLLAAVGAEGGTLRAIALNDYAIDIPVADAVRGGPVVAYLRNGAPMGLRDKGPLWIVYPYDSSPDYQTEQIYARSIWQLDRIEVRP